MSLYTQAPPEVTTTTTSVGQPPPLAATGVDTTPLLIAGLVAIVVGLLFVLVVARWVAGSASEHPRG